MFSKPPETSAVNAIVAQEQSPHNYIKLCTKDTHALFTSNLFGCAPSVVQNMTVFMGAPYRRYMNSNNILVQNAKYFPKIHEYT